MSLTISMKNKSKFLLGLLAFIALAACALFVLTIHQRHRAAAFLREFASLQIGATTFAEAQDLANRYGAKASGSRLKDPCSMKDCAFGFVFKNWLLNHFQRQREISLAAGITVKDGYVISKQLDYSICATSGDRFMYILFDRVTPEKDKGYAIKRGMINPQGMASVIEVDLGSNASAEVRKRAYSVDLACLSRVSGCDSLRDILPAYWSDFDVK
ncbi:MAG: hypothetical protein LAO56_26105 [Acidobacteriia bacterium]|nr:hypothetical protein [Terriglobia bacterium]